MMVNGAPYLHPSPIPPRGGAPIDNLDDLADDITIEFDRRVLEEARKCSKESLQEIGITSKGYRLLLYRPIVLQERENSIERFTLTSYPKSWREPFLQSIETFKEVDRVLFERYPEGYEQQLVPEREDIYRAFHGCPFESVRVVIVGQDPYTTIIGDRPIATGRAFALRKGLALRGMRAAASLGAIIDEVKRSYPTFRDNGRDYTLESWEQQGVLLLNASLTGERGKNEKANSHKGLWKNFIYNILQYIVNNKKSCIFVAWGAEAQKIVASIDPGNSFPVLTSGHPSPLAKGSKNPFEGNNHFLTINELLIANKQQPIDWSLEHRGSQ